ncbi:MAG: hypothetical protein PHD73_03385 [Sediminibacterium sp.]|nr:hypothetical protein [Sediminibacterium sp.]
MKMALTILLFLYAYPGLLGQDSSVQKKVELNGYIKAVEMYRFDKMAHMDFASHLIHNRLNFKWKPNKTVSLSAEFRNRIFLGEQIRMIPGFVESLRNEQEFWNLQKAWVQGGDVVFHTNIERLYLDFKKTHWDLRLGRQRINWGIATTWNPNDIFNAYNFLDVDYIERPGTDAAKLHLNTSDNSNIEFVYSAAANKKSIVASRFSINKWNYDFQIMAGSYQGVFTIGAGWAGNIKNAGFKGEAQYYSGNAQVKSQLNIAIGLDYMFKKGWYVNLGGLYNSNGINEEVSNWQNLDLKLSARNLMPGKWSYITTVQKEITPLFTAGASFVYSPKLNLIILMPSISYNISSTLDADLIYQSFYLRSGGTLNGITDIGFIRLRYSF